MPDMQYELSPAPTCGHKTFLTFANDQVYAALSNSLLSYLESRAETWADYDDHRQD